ncbi:MAG: hypothetical protein MZV65_25350 [Chromatiales bacterium]|nr:hypothetical protein [Chromatiales bacterium]
MAALSLQEVVVPVVRIHKARTDDTGRVEVELLRAAGPDHHRPAAHRALIRTGRSLDKVLPRARLRWASFAKDGTSLSGSRTLTFDSKATEARQRREPTVLIVLSPGRRCVQQPARWIFALEETVSGTAPGPSPTRAISLKLQKPFASDFE